MFTGIVEERGTVTAVEPHGDSVIVTVEATKVAGTVRRGDSVAVDGVCLTVTDVGGGRFSADVVRETLRRSGLGALRPGCAVNLERSVPVGGRLDGHLVQGHVDGVGRILSRQPGEAADPRSEIVRFGVPPELGRYLVPKGSVAVDGVSLTVVDCDDGRGGDGADGADGGHEAAFTVTVIPTTSRVTTLGAKGPGEQVNIEVDVIGKYLGRYLDTYLDRNVGTYLDRAVAKYLEPRLQQLVEGHLATRPERRR